MKEKKITVVKYELTETEDKVFSGALDLALDLSREDSLPKELKDIFSAYIMLFQISMTVLTISKKKESLLNKNYRSEI